MMRDWNIVYPVFLTVSTKWLLVIKEVFISHEWRRYQTRRAQVKRADVVFHLDWPTGCLRALCGMAELPVVIIFFCFMIQRYVLDYMIVNCVFYL